MDLTALTGRVRLAKNQRDTPPPPGGSKPLLLLDQYLTDDDWRLVRETVWALRREHGDTFALYTENALAVMLIDILASCDSAPALSQVANEIAALAEDEGPWLISTPLANITTAEPLTRLAEGVFLWRAHLGTAWLDERFSEPEDDSALTVRQTLGTHPRRSTRWLRLPGARRLDMARGASILSVEKGSPALAHAHATAKAQYAMAVWAVLHPPEEWHLLPDLASWGPQPHIQTREPYEKLSPGRGPSGRGSSAGMIREWSPYDAPPADLLRVPFEAMEARDRRCAQSLLSSSLALFQASRGSRHQLSERLRYLGVSIEALAEKRPGEAGAFPRWQRVAERHGVWDELEARGYRKEDITDIQRRLKTARDVATHGADAVLIDLGYPVSATRALQGRRTAAGEDLAFSSLHADLSPLIFAVRFVLRELLDQARSRDWDECAFEAEFAPT